MSIGARIWETLIKAVQSRHDRRGGCRVVRSDKRGVAQSGSASVLGTEGRRFESGLPDQFHKCGGLLNVDQPFGHSRFSSQILAFSTSQIERLGFKFENGKQTGLDSRPSPIREVAEAALKRRSAETPSRCVSMWRPSTPRTYPTGQ